ncbi:hypothetical protein K2173_023981 [Erythroxylum novogranatense]|uniref:Protein arginine N-methyltransferase n=1 Tax=Erythroxylum novogranatense TaxID=1862640 RepID=A0AAV8TPY4_9ROSI|nr:hypothetical protein K2173_023981 [Erythroxylum novogranatense]
MISLISKTLKTPSFLIRLSSTIFHSPFPLFASYPLRAMTSESTQRVFQFKFNPLTGNAEWVVIEDDQREETALLASTSYLDMLNDSTRNKTFREAIDKTITKPCHVLDIGAGTGLLSMMAVRAMGADKSEASVTAYESYLPMVKLMRKVLHINGMTKDVKIINKRSDEVEVGVDIASRADVLVTEILDSELLGEGLIPTLQHAHDKLLVDKPLTVPYRVTTYGQLVESTFLWKLHDLHNNEATAMDGIHLVPTGSDTILRVSLQQYPMHCDALSRELKLLSEPFKIFEFDFGERPASHGETKLVIKATDDGRVHAVVSWWILQLDHEGAILYSTAPRWIGSPSKMGIADWCDHWKQCVWFIPGEGMPISKGEEVLFHAFHTETRILYNVATQAKEMKLQDFSNTDFHLVLPPERIAIYGDRKWRSSMVTALRNALQKSVDPLCVVADDSVFLTLLVAHLSKSSHILSLFPGLRERGAQYLRAVATANGFAADRVEVVLKRKNLTLDDTCQRKVDLLIGEPYYHGNDGMLPWQNLRFWKERTILDSVLANGAVVIPCKAILRACAMSLPDLWKSRCCLNKIEGFDHSVVNSTLGACGELPAGREVPLLPFFIWQCGETQVLSDTVTVMDFDLTKPMSSCYGKVQVEFTKSGICHGFALWIDWVMDTKDCVVISTGSDQRYWKQGVKLLPWPVEVENRGERSSAIIEASFDPSTGELTFNHSVS